MIIIRININPININPSCPVQNRIMKCKSSVKQDPIPTRPAIAPCMITVLRRSCQHNLNLRFFFVEQWSCRIESLAKKLWFNNSLRFINFQRLIGWSNRKVAFSHFNSKYDSCWTPSERCEIKHYFCIFSIP